MKCGEHLVIFHGDDDVRLVPDVARYLHAALACGGAGVVIANAVHCDAIAGELKRRARSSETLIGDRLILLDDAQTLATFMRDGQPDAVLFEANVGGCVRGLCDRYGRVRAYGEMVGRLWAERAYAPAIELERLWNDLLQAVDFDLYCGYPIDVLSYDFQISAMRPLLAAHTKLVPSLPETFETAMRRAMDDMFGDHWQGLHGLTNAAFTTLATSLPDAETTILRLRSILPRYADQIVARARIGSTAET